MKRNSGSNSETWIDINERLPEKDQRVIYYFEIAGTHMGRFYGGDCKDNAVFGGLSGRVTGNVTHWMPLPPPPRQQAATRLKIVRAHSN